LIHQKLLLLVQVFTITANLLILLLKHLDIFKLDKEQRKELQHNMLVEKSEI
jgi:hypothetical protein